MKRGNKFNRFAKLARPKQVVTYQGTGTYKVFAVEKGDILKRVAVVNNAPTGIELRKPKISKKIKKLYKG